MLGDGKEPVLTFKPPSKLRRKSLYFVKRNGHEPVGQDIASDVIAGELAENPLDQLNALSQEVTATSTRCSPRESPRKLESKSILPLERPAALPAPPQVFLPILTNPRNQAGWPEVIAHEVMDNMHKFVANVYVTIGQTQVRPAPIAPRVQRVRFNARHQSRPS